MDEFSDAQLIEASLAGNRAAFGVLAERYQAMLLQVAYSQIGDSEVAHDLAQESLLQAFLSLGQLREPSRFRAWVYGIALNVCRDFLRSQDSKPLSFADLAGGIHIADEMPSPEKLAEQLELRQTIQRALNSLSESNRAAISLFYYEGFSTPEIADMLEISVGAVKVRLHKARQQLKIYLEAVLPIVHQTKGAKSMLAMIVADTQTIVGTNPNGTNYTMYQVILFNAETRRALVIWIGEAEARAIALGIRRDTSMSANRPITQQLMMNLLKAADSTVEAVEIAKMEADIYYASIKVKTADGKFRSVDARPSDALALAVWNDIPIFAAEKVLEENGAVVPEGKAPHRRGIDNILKPLLVKPEPKILTAEEFAKLNIAPDTRTEQQKVQEAVEAVIEMAFE